MEDWDDEQALFAQRKRRIAEQSKDSDDEEEDEEKQRQERAERERKQAKLKRRQLDEIFNRKFQEQPTRPEHQGLLAQLDEKSEIEAVALRRSQEQGRHAPALRAQRQAYEEEEDSEWRLEPGGFSDEEIFGDAAEEELEVLRSVRDFAKPKHAQDRLYFHKEGKVIRDQLASGRLSPESCKFAFVKAVSDAQSVRERLHTFFLLHEMCYTLYEPGMIPVVVKVLEHLEQVCRDQDRTLIARCFREWENNRQKSFFHHICRGKVPDGEYFAVCQYERVFLPNWADQMQEPRVSKVVEDINGIVDLDSDSDDDDGKGGDFLSQLSFAPEVPTGEDDGAAQQVRPRPSVKPDLVEVEAAARRHAKYQRC